MSGTWKKSPTGEWDVHPGDVPPHVRLTPENNFCIVECDLCGCKMSVFWVGVRKEEKLLETVVSDHKHGWAPPEEEVVHMTKIDVQVAAFPDRLVKLLASKDAEQLQHKHSSYGDSWKKRGGVGAFMMLARKWDRIENQVRKHGWDIEEAINFDSSAEGIIDDIRDLRRYLLLVEAEWGDEGQPEKP